MTEGTTITNAYANAAKLILLSEATFFLGIQHLADVSMPTTTTNYETSLCVFRLTDEVVAFSRDAKATRDMVSSDLMEKRLNFTQKQPVFFTALAHKVLLQCIVVRVSRAASRATYRMERSHKTTLTPMPMKEKLKKERPCHSKKHAWPERCTRA